MPNIVYILTNEAMPNLVNNEQRRTHYVRRKLVAGSGFEPLTFGL
jgi:hypothetical protein